MQSAAVMVGAGFSRNADKISSDVPDFPLWKPLIEKMLQQLNPGRTYTNNSDALRIANEYEIMFTRPILDEFLLNIIPDNLYQPGELHKILLELPWSDIFTTNYDTLLEKTCPYVPTNHYDFVSSIPDIPNKKNQE